MSNGKKWWPLAIAAALAWPVIRVVVGDPGARRSAIPAAAIARPIIRVGIGDAGAAITLEAA